MYLNIIKIIFISMAFFTGFSGLILTFFENHMPVSFSKLYRHGKFCANVKHGLLDKLEVPKRWFKHFYVFAGPLSTAALVLIYYRYCLNKKLPDTLIWMLQFFMGKPAASLIPTENIFIGIIILTVHCWKRFYESHFISIFSDVYMTFGIYLIGLIHYFGTIISVIGESNNITSEKQIDLDWTRLNIIDYICSLTCLASTYLQFRTNIILSNLRKNKKGEVVTKKYKVPKGELFNYISAPLQFTEIILYINLSIILRTASTFHFVTLWVIVNQVQCAYFTHEWSLKTFEDYPKSRNIIIPFIF